MKWLLVFAFLIIYSSSFSQYDKKTTNCIKKIDKKIYNWKDYEALKICSKCLKKSKSKELLYEKRGEINEGLNLMSAAANDYKIALQLSNDNLSDSTYMKWIADTLFVIKNITDSLHFPGLDSSLNYRKPFTRADTLRGMLSVERSCFDVFYQKLTFKIFPETKSIEGFNEILFTAKSPHKRIQIDLFDNMKLDSIIFNGEKLMFNREFNAVFIDLPEKLINEKQYKISVFYHGTPRDAPDPPWNGGFVWGKNQNRHHVGVACEHLGASCWWPNKDHLSDEPDSMDIFIIAPNGYDVISNGNLIGKKSTVDEFTEFQWHVSYPINNYNVSFYLGDFINFEENYISTSKDTVSVDYYVTKENETISKKYYSETIRIIEEFESLFGSYPFPKDGLAFVESPFSGMEHQSAIAIGNEYENQSSYETVGDHDLLVVHETAHEWWGNSISVGDMADLWIHEGFATYAEHLFIEKVYGKEEYLNFVGNNMLNISNIWPVIGTKDVNDNNAQGGDIYNKGAATLHSLRCIFDDDFIFFKMIKDFYRQNKLKIVNTEDFTSHAQSYTKNNLSPFFQVFLHQSSPPVLEYAFVHKRKKLSLSYKWTNVPEGFEMPILIVSNFGQTKRLDCSSEEKWISGKNISDFYFYSSNNMDVRLDTKNSFTYYHSKLNEMNN